jgi:hypothetical protein
MSWVVIASYIFFLFLWLRARKTHRHDEALKRAANAHLDRRQEADNPYAIFNEWEG